MMDRWIGILGSNATGKSTRVNALVDSKGDDYAILEYTWDSVTAKYPEGRKRTLTAGRVYGDTIILGRKSRTGNWVGTDYVFGELGNFDAIFGFIDWLRDQGIKNVVGEGYFAMSSDRFHPDHLREKSVFKNTDLYFFLYDTPQEYLDRTNTRTGKDFTEDDWKKEGRVGKVPTGWRSNGTFHKKFNRAKDKAVENDNITRVDIDADVDYFVGKI